MAFTNINKLDIKDKIKSIKSNAGELKRSPVIKFTDLTPVFGTFYNINIKASSSLTGTDDIQNDIGEDSPLRFNKINNFVMYWGELWDRTQEDDEYKGMRIEGNNRAMIPRDSFEPLVNSFFSLDFDKHVYLYRVTHVQKTALRNESSYVIEFERVFSDEDDEHGLIEEQVVENFTMIYDNIGTELKSIIKNDIINDLEVLEKKIKKLNTLYMSQYFDENTETIIIKNPNTIFYSPYVTQFITEGNILYGDEYGNKIILTEQFGLEEDFKFMFHNSFYIKTLNKEQLIEEDMKFTIEYLDDNSYEFNFTPLNIYHNRDIVIVSKNKTIFKMHDYGQEVDLLELSLPSESSTMSIDKFLHEYINGNFDISLIDIDEMYNEYDINHMFKIPLIIFIVRYEYNNKIGKSMLGYNEIFSNRLI